MYHPISIDGLSNAQINKLLAGHPVRVKHGKQHQIKVSAEQYKKHAKAAQKGKGVTIMMDPYQQEMHQHLKGCGIMSSLKKVAGHARTAFGHAKTAYGHAKAAAGHASKFYGENKETLEPYGNILKSQAHKKVEHYTEKAQPHLTKHLGEFGSHLGSHASRVAHESIQNFGELPEPISEQQIVENELEGMGFHRKVKRSVSHLRSVASSHPRMQGGKINIGKVLSKVGNVAVKGISDYAKSKQGQALIQHGIKLGTDAALMSAGLPPVAGLGLHKKRGRPRKGGALYAAGYGSY